jgi:hypothetical protein
MKTNHLIRALALALGLAAMAAATTRAAPAASTASAPTEWRDIKDTDYDTRAHFFAGYKQLAARVEEQIRELTARRAAMKSAANPKDWDFAMKEMVNARSYLLSVGEEVRKALPETWDQVKEKAGQAWERTQEAYARVKASTTR